MEGSFTTIPFPFGYSSVVAVPRSIAKSEENKLNSERMFMERFLELLHSSRGCTTSIDRHLTTIARGSRRVLPKPNIIVTISINFFETFSQEIVAELDSRQRGSSHIG